MTAIFPALRRVVTPQLQGVPVSMLFSKMTAREFIGVKGLSP
jgi:hypothetical protein